MTKKRLQKIITKKMGDGFTLDDSTMFCGYDNKYCIRKGTNVITKFNTLNDGYEYIQSL